MNKESIFDILDTDDVGENTNVSISAFCIITNTNTKTVLLDNYTHQSKPNKNDNINDDNEFHKNNNTKNTKEKEKRVITKNQKWCFNNEDFLFENQIEFLNRIIGKYTKASSVYVQHWTPPKGIVDVENHVFDVDTNDNKKEKIIIQEIQRKINSYKNQDVIKKKFNKELFVDLFQVLTLLNKCLLNCFYCNKKVCLFYENVREPKQWSLERIDNSKGHIINNVEISCLSCNIKRRTMYHERFLFTKQLTIKKI